jgi:hypothetical protein
MTLIASLLFATAFAMSVGVSVMTVSNAMPRISQVIDMEFAPAMQTERRINFGEVKGLKPARAAQIITFPRRPIPNAAYRLAA